MYLLLSLQDTMDCRFVDSKMIQALRTAVEKENTVQMQYLFTERTKTYLGCFFFCCCFFYNCIVPSGFLPWEIQVAFPGESQQRWSNATQPSVHTRCFSVLLIHQTLTWTTGSLTYAPMLMHAVAHRGVQTP